MLTNTRWVVLALALTVVGCAGSADVDGESADFDSTAVEGAARLTFDAAWNETASRALHVGDKVEIAFDPARLPQCRGEQGGVPQWSITGYAAVGDAASVSFPVAGLNAPSALPTVALSQTGDLHLWFEANDRWGCDAWDSNFGNDYRFPVSLGDDAPGWVGNAASVISRATCDDGRACDDSRVALANGFTFDTWARQRAAIAGVYFDVWKEGVTDFDNADLWQDLDVQVHHRFADADAFATAYVSFDHRVGHDARYALPLRPLDPFAGHACPTMPLGVTADGQYVTAQLSFYFTVNGVELRPATGGEFHGQFQDYKSRVATCP